MDRIVACFRSAYRSDQQRHISSQISVSLLLLLLPPLYIVGDVFPTPASKAAEFGNITGCFVVGQSIGGIFAILMSSTGLFASLWIGAAMMAIAGVTMTFVCVEPKYFALPKDNDDATVLLEDGEEEADGNKELTEIDKPTMWNIMAGALLDNIGSCGLFPICLSPLAFNRFYDDFASQGLPPLLSLNGYKWVSIMVALVVIPTAALAPPVYRRIGPAGACVFGNFMTAVVILLLWIFGAVLEATKGAMIGFILVMYLGFPMTVFSQLSTSPMLDMCSPRDQRGFVQGLNSTVMNVGTAFAPWVLGIVADQVSTNAAVFIGLGVSLVAAAVNAPLMWKKGMGRPEPPKEPAYKRVMKGEEADIVERALRGSWISQEALTAINDQRETKHQPYLYIHPRPYAEEKDQLALVRKEAQTDFQFALRRTDGILGAIARGQPQRPLDEACKQANKALAANSEEANQINTEVGQWFADYLSDNGYYAHTNPGMIKEMIMNAFPTITQQPELDPENLEQVLLNMRRLYAQHAELAKPRWNYSSILGTGSTRTLTYV